MARGDAGMMTGRVGPFQNLQPFFYWACERGQAGNNRSACNGALAPGMLQLTFDFDYGFEATRARSTLLRHGLLSGPDPGLHQPDPMLSRRRRVLGQRPLPVAGKFTNGERRTKYPGRLPCRGRGSELYTSRQTDWRHSFGDEPCHPGVGRSGWGQVAFAKLLGSVAPTLAGEELLARLGPALADIREALDRVRGFRDKPAGRVRLLVSRVGAMAVLAPNWDSLPEITPISCSMSRQMTAASISSRLDSTPVFISASSLRKT